MIGKTITFQIKECKNLSTLISCASKPEIDKYVEDIFLDTIAITSQIDFKAVQNGKKQIGEKPVFQDE